MNTADVIVIIAVLAVSLGLRRGNHARPSVGRHQHHKEKENHHVNS